MPAKDLIEVLDIDLVFGEMKFGSNPMHNLKQINSFFKHKHYATT
jgi:hypothetical protein